MEYLHWRMIFFVNIPIGLLGLYFVYRLLPDYYGTRKDKADIIGLILFGSGVALFSYVVEVFGEHSLGAREILGLLVLSLVLILGYAYHATQVPHPLLRLGLLRIRTLRISITGNLITRLGAGGIPFLLPLLYQVGLGYSPLQSGLLIMPQSLAAISLKFLAKPTLKRFGYRRVLLSNTIMIGMLICLFATIHVGTPAWLIVIQAALYGYFTSLQYTSMNTLIYADVNDHDTSMASTILSTAQQMSMSFGVAMASLATAFFIQDRFHSGPAEMIQGLHKAFLVLGSITVFSAVGFQELKNEDGESVSEHHEH